VISTHLDQPSPYPLICQSPTGRLRGDGHRGAHLRKVSGRNRCGDADLRQQSDLPRRTGTGVTPEEPHPFVQRRPGKDFIVAARQSTGAALTVASVAGAGIVLAGLLAVGGLGVSLATTGLLLPGLLVQDSYKMVSFTMGRPVASAANDSCGGVWCRSVRCSP
jgi:hypothetical protein